MSKKQPVLTESLIRKYLTYLQEQERSPHTISKYAHDIGALLTHLDGAPITKVALIDWKEQLTGTLAPASVNSMLVAVNGLFQFCGWQNLKIKLLKIQKSVFIDEEKELSRAVYRS